MRYGGSSEKARSVPGGILIIKLSAIGDVVHSIPLLETLRVNFPGARIDWIVESEASPILEGHAAIDRLFVSRRKPWRDRIAASGARVSVLREVFRFVKEVRRHRYDVVIDLQGLLKSGILAGLVRGRSKIGLAGAREGSWLFYSRRQVPVDRNQHAIDRYLHVADYLKCRRVPLDGRIPVDLQDRERIEELIGSGSDRSMPLIAINPMARWPTKLWRPERFSELADRIHHELSSQVVFTGSSSDRDIVESICKRMRHRPLNLAGKTTLKELAYLYSISRALVCTDTGPMHIAAAMGCRVVALFGPTSPLRTGPYGEGHRVVRAEEMTCSPCFKRTCDRRACMDAIHTDQVFSAVKDASG